MRFTSFIVAGLFAVAANAQTSTAASGATVTSSTAPAQTSLTEIEKCLAACDPSDTACRAHCIAVPSPNNASVNATTNCVAGCDQGSGSAADNKAYGDCVDACIAKYYFTSTGTPNLATSGAGNGASGSDSDSGASATPSVTQVPTTFTSGGSTFTSSVPSTVNPGTSNSADSSAPSTSSTPNAAAVYGPVGAGMGLFGLLMGFVAL